MTEESKELSGQRGGDVAPTGGSLVQIGLKPRQSEASQQGVSRRRFLQIAGGASAASAIGCADDKKQTIFPRVNAEDAQIPGERVFFRSTCSECSAGCGIEVTVVDGRAIKIEGNPASPINRGSLCALGQASLQGHYDPDRVREPLKKTTDKSGRPQFVPVSWDEALQDVAGRLKIAGKRNAFVSGGVSGSLLKLVDEFGGTLNCSHVVYDLTDPVAVAKASELVFGVYGVPRYAFESAEAVVSFGADFLETWVSPCEYAKGWSRARRSDKSLKFVQVESRLSLTGANADLWLRADAGSEVKVALALLAEIFAGRNGVAGPAIRRVVSSLLANVSLDRLEDETGVTKEQIQRVAKLLNSAESSLVISGGSTSATSNSVALGVVVNLINLLLGNLGKTIHLDGVRVPKSSPEALASLVDDLKAKKIGVLFTYNTNPAFTFPSSFGFGYAAKDAELTVALATHLDETAWLADYVLPVNSGLESWGDVVPYAGVRSIKQPVMAPLFNTREFGDILLAVAAKAGSPLGGPNGSDSFLAYLQEQWQSLYAESRSRGLTAAHDFKRFWLESVERGGLFTELPASTSAPVPRISDAILSLNYGGAELAARAAANEEVDVVLLPYLSVKSFDGRSANRPWLQELPDPVTQIVWDSWIELHPDTAKGIGDGIELGDLITLRNFYGEVTAPAYITEHVAPGAVAVPIGQGHKEYGRFAKSVGAGNVVELLPPTLAAASGGVPLLATKVKAHKAPGRHRLVILSGSDSQHGRELAQRREVNAFSPGAAAFGGAMGASHGKDPHGEHTSDDHHSNDHHSGKDHGGGHDSGAHYGGHHEPKQMYQQREHPLFRWAMAVDLAACTGCAACVVACYAENNIPVVGKDLCDKGREMSWLRIERYYDNQPGEELRVSFLPMMCQHCGNAPCEPVCPVYATYHNEEGLNAMVYNRCVGTRYCSNNCSYKVRRFNWVDVEFPDTLSLQINPYVTKRTMGVMEKCTFCVQRIVAGKDHAKDRGEVVKDGEITPACVQSCPTEALVFGNLNDPDSRVSKVSRDGRAYKILDHHLNTQPGVSYLADVKFSV